MSRRRVAIAVIMAAVTFVCVGFHALLYMIDNRALLPGPRARAGYLDLGEWNLEEDGLLALTDGWMFYEGVHVTPGSDPDTRGIPSAFDSFRGREGIGTYRLIMRKTPRESQLVLQGSPVYSAVAIYVNGVLVQELGASPPGSADPGEAEGTVLSAFYDPGELVEIVIHIGNTPGTVSARGVLILGTAYWVIGAYSARMATAVLAIAACLFAGFYALLIYFHQRHAGQRLMFAIICFLAAGGIIILPNAIFSLLRGAPAYDIAVPVIAMLQLFFVTKFVEIMYGTLEHGWHTPVLSASAALLFVLSLAVKGVARDIVWTALCALALLATVRVLAILARAAEERRPGSIFYLVGILCYLVFGILHSAKILWYEPVYFASPAVYGTPVLIVAYAAEISRSYAKHYASVVSANLDLERAIEERTSELTEANLRLRSAESARRDMVASISHDLRAPLTSIRGHVDLLMDDDGEDGARDREERRRYLGLIRARTESMEHLVRDLYYFSSLESKSLSFSYREVPLLAYLEDVFYSFQADSQFQGLSLAMDAPESDARINIDPERMQQVFNNLFFNALRYTPAGGSIILSLELSVEESVVRVTDSGQGITPSDLPHVFERFYKASRARGSNEGGSGLGLAIAKGIIERHGGRIWAESEPGQGTTFSFTLPLVKPS